MLTQRCDINGSKLDIQWCLKGLKRIKGEAVLRFALMCFCGAALNCQGSGAQPERFLMTFAPQWDLVCKLRPLKQMSQTIYMGGVLSGAIIFGGLSDK